MIATPCNPNHWGANNRLISFIRGQTPWSRGTELYNKRAGPKSPTPNPIPKDSRSIFLCIDQRIHKSIPPGGLEVYSCSANSLPAASAASPPAAPCSGCRCFRTSGRCIACPWNPAAPAAASTPSGAVAAAAAVANCLLRKLQGWLGPLGGLNLGLLAKKALLTFSPQVQVELLRLSM